MSRPSSGFSFVSVETNDMSISSISEVFNDSTVVQTTVEKSYQETPTPQTPKDDSLEIAQDAGHEVDELSPTTDAVEPPSDVLQKEICMNDGTMVFLIEGKFFQVERFFFQRDSTKFRTLFAQHAETPIGKTDDHPLELNSTSALDFERFLAILYPTDFNAPPLNTLDEWASALRVAHNWGFSSIRALAARSLAPLASSVDKIVFGREFGFDEWLLDAFVELCVRDEGLSLGQAERLRLEDVTTIWTLRQGLWRGEVLVDDVRESVCHLCGSQTEDTKSPLPAFPPAKSTESLVARAQAKLDARKQSASRAHHALLEAERELGCAWDAEAKLAEEKAAKEKELERLSEHSSLQSQIEARKVTLAKLDIQVAQRHADLAGDRKLSITSGLDELRRQKSESLVLAAAEAKKWKDAVERTSIATRSGSSQLREKKMQTESHRLIAEAEVNLLKDIERLLTRT